MKKKDWNKQKKCKNSIARKKGRKEERKKERRKEGKKGRKKEREKERKKEAFILFNTFHGKPIYSERYIEHATYIYILYILYLTVSPKRFGNKSAFFT